MKKNRSSISRIAHSIKKHKILSTVIVVTVLVGGYGIYKSAASANTSTQYTLQAVHTGTITQTVTGSGQVYASNQTDILGQVSGTIESIAVSVGQKVTKGELIATIDPTNAENSLASAQLSLDKLMEPPTEAELSNARNNLMQSYSNGYNAAATIYLDLPDIVIGMKDMLYSQNGFLSDQRSSYLSSVARNYRDKAGLKYDRAVKQYNLSLEEYNNTNRSSATSTIDSMIANTYTTIQEMSEAVADAQGAINFITTTQPDYNPDLATSAASDVNSWASKTNSDLSSLVSTQNSIKSNSNSLSTLIQGSDALDIRSAQLSLEQARRTYSNYFVRALYDGTIARIPVSVYGQSGASTVIATIIGNEKIASISLNEVDASKVATGQPVEITFDAIDGLNATGTVSVVDQIGTVSSGVVSYGVKISINTEDPRIKPGMSVNVTIITDQKIDILVVPTSAVKTQGGVSYVQVFDSSVINANKPSMPTNRVGMASSTMKSAAITISSETAPRRTTVTTGLSDDTNIEITSGLTAGQYIVTKTTTSVSSQTTSTGSIFGLLGGNRSKTTGSNSNSNSNSSSKKTTTSSSATMGGGGGFPPPQ